MKHKYLTRKNVLTCSISLIALSFVFLVLLPCFQVNAYYIAFIDLMLEQFNAGVMGNLKDIFTNTSLSDSVNVTAVTVSTSIKGIGMGIVVLHAYMKMITEVHRGQNGVEAFIKVIIEICGAALVIIYLDDVLAALDTLGLGILNLISTDSGNSGLTLNLEDIFTPYPTGNGFFDVIGKIMWEIGAIFGLLVPYLATLGLSVAVKIVSYSILLELAIRKAFAPIAIGDIVGEGLRSPGVRYFKRYLAVYLKMAICVVIAIAIKNFSAAVAANETGVLSGLSFLFNNIAINFTGVSLMFKTGEFANDIVGA